MLTALVASLLCAQADGVRVDAPKDWARREDPQKRFVAYTPPGLAAGQDATLLVYPPIDAAVPVDVLLDGMVQNMSQGKRLLGKIEKVDVGVFRVAVFSQQAPQGWMEHLAVHAVRWGGKGQALLFAANDAELFKKHAGAVAAELAKVKRPAAPEPAAGAFFGLNLAFPAGWTRTDDPSGWIIMTPPQNLSFGNPRLWIGPSIKIEGSHWEAHRSLLKKLVESAKWPGSYNDSLGATRGPFIRSNAHCTADARQIALWTAAAGGQMEVLMLSPTGGDEVIAALMPVLEKATLKAAPADAPKRPEIVEAYRRPNMKKFLNRDGTFFFGSLKYERVMLLANGVVDFTTTHAEGYDGDPEILKVDAGTQNGFYGKWTGDGKDLTIVRWAGKPAEAWTRENGNLRFGDQTWTPVPRVDGLKLKGRYAYKSEPGPSLQFNYWIDFTEDGRFECADFLTWLAVSDFTGRPKPPAKAAGTYEIRNWTIWFKVDGRPVWSTDLEPQDDSARDPATLLINTYPFKRP